MIQNAQMGVDPRNQINDLTNEEWEGKVSSVKMTPEEKEIIVQCKPILDQTRNLLIQRIGLERFKKVWGEHLSNAVFYPYQHPDQFVREHPAPFDVREVEDTALTTTKSSDIIFDPFTGSGSTFIAALKTGRRCAGVELMDHFYDLTARRISAYIGAPYKYGERGLYLKKGDCREVMTHMKDSVVDSIISSPPYYNILKRGTGERARQRNAQGLKVNYGNSGKDLGNIDNYPTFMNEMRNTYSLCHRILKKGKFMTIIVSDIFSDGRFIPYGADTLKVVESVGFKSQGVQVILDTWKKNRPYGIPYRVSFTFHHHYALVFQKI